MSTILVVDDEMGIRELLSEILSDEGHVVLTAENAAVARRLREQESPDLVLLDIWMPDTDGVTLLKEWAVNGKLTIPVIMMSGHATIDTAVEATRFGALDFLEKPIALSRLLSAVKAGLERGRLLRSFRGMEMPSAFIPVTTEAPAPVMATAAAAPVEPLSVAKAEEVAEKKDNAIAEVSFDQPLRLARDQFERVYFEYHLARENYSMTRVADRAGLERTHLYRKLKQLGVELMRNGRRVAPSAVNADANLDAVEAEPATTQFSAAQFGVETVVPSVTRVAEADASNRAGPSPLPSSSSGVAGDEHQR